MNATKRFAEVAASITGHAAQGLADDVIAAVPAAITTTPATWRAFMQQVGDEPELLSAFQRFRAPADLEVIEGLVIFAEENQRVVLWGWRIEDAGLDDPPVFQLVSTSEGPDGPFPEDAVLSAFMTATLVMQATYGDGLMPFMGYVERGMGTSSTLLGAGLVEVAVAGALTAFIGEDVAATIIKDEHGETVMVGCAKEAVFERFADVLGVDADFFEL